MKYADISGLSAAELTKRSAQANIQIFEAKMKNALGQLANPMEIRALRRDVARLATAQTAKAAKTPLSKASREDRRAASLKALSKTAAKSKAVKG